MKERKKKKTTEKGKKGEVGGALKKESEVE